MNESYVTFSHVLPAWPFARAASTHEIKTQTPGSAFSCFVSLSYHVLLVLIQSCVLSSQSQCRGKTDLGTFYLKRYVSNKSRKRFVPQKGKSPCEADRWFMHVYICSDTRKWERKLVSSFEQKASDCVSLLADTFDLLSEGHTSVLA